MQCFVQIDAGEDREDVGLQERDQQFEPVSATVMPAAYGAIQPMAPAAPSRTTKPANTFSTMWPASMLANRRTNG